MLKCSHQAQVKYKIRAADTADCICGSEVDTEKHFLFGYTR